MGRMFVVGCVVLDVNRPEAELAPEGLLDDQTHRGVEVVAKSGFDLEEGFVYVRVNKIVGALLDRSMSVLIDSFEDRDADVPLDDAEGMETYVVRDNVDILE